MPDNWKGRVSGMICATCVFFVPKDGNRGTGRCRRRCPTMTGFPVVFPPDWCGDHKLHEDYRDEMGEPLPPSPLTDEEKRLIGINAEAKFADALKTLIKSVPQKDLDTVLQKHFGKPGLG